MVWTYVVGQTIWLWFISGGINTKGEGVLLHPTTPSHPPTSTPLTPPLAPITPTHPSSYTHRVMVWTYVVG